MDDKRYIPVKESLLESCKEVKAMRSGKAPESSWDDFCREMQAETKKEPIAG